MIKFVFLDTLGLNINFDLIALQRNSQRYSTLLYQHEGILSANRNKVGNKNSVIQQFQLFLSKAKEQNVDLVLTPEYSCPWELISSIISNTQDWPQEGKLWVFGCESIKIEEIKSFKSKHSVDNTIIYYDESVYASNKSFLDPLIYLFQAKDNNHAKLVIIVQFKTHHMGVWSGGDLERNNLIQGKEIYIIRNSINSIYFMSLICSEAMNLSNELNEQNKLDIDWEDKPFLIFNPQLNPDPSHADFISFRKFVFQSNDKEIISLNWQVNSKIASEKMLKNNFSRSGYYIKSNEIELIRENRIIENHKKGLYYFNNKKNRHTYLLSSDPHCFLIENPPVKILNAQQVQIRRDGPEVIEAFSFNDQISSLICIKSVCDEHINYLLETGCVNMFLLNPTNCVLDKERLVCLSTGDVNGETKINWWNISNVGSIFMDENQETNGRLTVAQNTCLQSLKIRTKFIDAINELKNILDNKINHPDNLSDYKNEKLILSFYNDSYLDHYRFNVISEKGQRIFATIAFVGSMPDSQIDKVYCTMRELFNRTDAKDIERVVVFYRRGNYILAKSDENVANFVTTNVYGDTSIMKD